MKNVKIKPYPNYKISDDCVERDVKPATQPIETATPKERNEALNFNNQKVVIVEFEGERRVCKFGPAVKSGGADYFSMFPNPVHLFLSSAINSFENTEKIKKENFVECGKKGKKIGDAIFLDVEKDGTHECYNEYIRQRMTSIIMLTASIESFLNYVIPNTFVYTNSSGDVYDKGRIENMRFKDKLKDVLPLALSRPTFWDNKDKEKGILGELYNIRKEIIHLKTNATEDFEAYFDEMNKMTKFDLERAIRTVIDFMNYTEPGFVEQLID